MVSRAFSPCPSPSSRRDNKIAGCSATSRPPRDRQPQQDRPPGLRVRLANILPVFFQVLGGWGFSFGTQTNGHRIYDDGPVVSYAYYDGATRNLRVRRFGAGAWTDLGSPMPTQSDGIHPAMLALSGGGFLMAWADDVGTPLLLSRYRAGAWEPSARVPAPSIARPPYPVLAAHAGRIFLAHHGYDDQGWAFRINLP
mgnify:CR=1 FL=1